MVLIRSTVCPPRAGSLYTNSGAINVTNAKYRDLFEPIEHDCPCYTCKHHTTAYLHHLFNSHELLAYNLASIHNLFFITNLIKRIRESILDNSFEKFREEFKAIYR